MAASRWRSRRGRAKGDFWLVATLGYPSLGLDLELGPRTWRDRLASQVLRTGLTAIDQRFAAHAREHAQALTVLTPALLSTVASFEEVCMVDASTTLARRGSAHVLDTLSAFVRDVVATAKELDGAVARVPAPAALADDVPAWRAFAERFRGRLELGRMQVHDAVIGMDRVTLGTEWTRSGVVVGTRLRVAIDPPLAAPPATCEDPALAPAARAAWRELLASTRSLRIEPSALVVEIGGTLADPAAALPIVELAVALRRSLSGLTGARPFR